MGRMTVAEVTAFLEKVFPQVAGQFCIDCIEEAALVMRLKVDDRHLRPGGTISGPSMFALADVAAYVMTLSRIGPEALTVTTHCSIDFMRKPDGAKDLVARAQLMKHGRSMSVTHVVLYSEGCEDPVAQASLFDEGPEEPGCDAPVHTLVKADMQCLSVAAASVLAKVERDRQMAALHAEYPAFGWDENKGYGTAAHKDALRAAGPTPYHRVSWQLLGD